MADKDLSSVQEARDAVEAAHAAQAVLATFDQAKVDRICAAMAQAALREATRLGAMAVEETGFGIADDKREKNRFAAEDVWNYFKNLRTVGVIAESQSVMEIASPRGVVAAIIPSTNPTSTAIFKCLISIKSRNAVVLSPHPSAARCIAETVRVVREAAVKEGLPADAIRCLTNATIEGTESLMKHKRTAVILATGGIGLVRAAYSSGKPAFGVGPGNVPVFVERTADVPLAVQNILTGKCFDNGTICASEQAVVADAPVARQVREEFIRQGAHFLSPAEADQLAKVVATPQRTLNPQIVGKSVETIAKLAGLSVPPGTRCLIAEVGGVGRDFPLSMEKLSPILAFYVEDGVEKSAARCFEVLKYGGMGHTAGIHTRSRDVARIYGEQMPASRVIVNSPTTHGAIGFSTALPPSMTLGCGSWGGNVTSDNISPIHLLDIKRVAFETRPVKSARPAVTQTANAPTMQRAPAFSPLPANAQATAQASAQTPQVSREQIAALVDKFLAARTPTQETATATTSGASNETAAPSPAAIVAPSESVKSANANGDGAKSGANQTASNANVGAANGKAGAATTNGHKPMEFVCEEDVRRAIQKGEKIYINARTIITPAARDLGEAEEIFGKV